MTQAALERRKMTGPAMWAVGTTASAPMAVMLGAIPVIYATTGVTAVPLVFLIAGTVLGLLSVGYTAMARQVPHPAVYYATISRGIGRPFGVAAGLVALLAYNAIQISLYGLLGADLSEAFGVPWWVPALIVVAVVAGFGMVGVTRLTVALTVMLAVSLILIALFLFAAFDDPTQSVTVTGFTPSGLTGQVGGAMAYALASFMGFESTPSFAEESRRRRAPGQALAVALTFLVVLYALIAWGAGEGARAGSPDTMAVFDDQYGPVMPYFVRFFYWLAVIASMIALHSIAARYGFAMARDGILPAAVAYTGRAKGTGPPVGGSLLQTGTALIVIAVFALAGTDPVASLFAWGSTLGPLGLLCLLLLSAVAAWHYLPGKKTKPARIGPHTTPPPFTTPPSSGTSPGTAAEPENVFVRRIAPGLGVLAGLWVLYLMVTNLDAQLGTAPGSPVPALVIAAIPATFLAGLLRALRLYTTRAQTYDRIGTTQDTRSAVPDSNLGQFTI
jgi:amino acid transporter